MTLQAPNKKQLQVVLAEINEDQDTLQQNLNILHNWLSYQPHLPSVEDQIMVSFLRGCKHNVERAKRKIDSYYTGRAAVQELFSNRDPCSREVKMGAAVLNVYPLPDVTPEGCRVTIHKFQSFDPDQLDIQGIFKYLLMLADIRLREEAAISGDVYIFDLQEVNLVQSTKFANAITLLRKTLILAQEAYPQRLKEIHILDAPPFVDWILNVFRSLMKEKMRNRFHIHTGHEELKQYLPLGILPKEYGGTGKSAREYHEDWLKKLELYQEWFKEQEHVKADEKRRPHGDLSCKTSLPLFGYEGAFRSLSVD